MMRHSPLAKRMFWDPLEELNYGAEIRNNKERMGIDSRAPPRMPRSPYPVSSPQYDKYDNTLIPIHDQPYITEVAVVGSPASPPPVTSVHQFKIVLKQNVVIYKIFSHFPFL